MVLDASITVARVHVEERTQPVEEVFRVISSSFAWVPALWYLEVANVFQMKIRRKNTARNNVIDIWLSLPHFLSLQIPKSLHAWKDTLMLAQKHDLTVYDAAYLELALRRGIPLATLDRELRAAASRERITLLGL